jgi:hypothetical protein
MSYFALSLPPSDSASIGDLAEGQARVFQSMEDALKALKSNKNSRLKAFAKLEEAVQFASDLNESVVPPNTNRYCSKNIFNKT